jgi:hypothetical protein
MSILWFSLTMDAAAGLGQTSASRPQEGRTARRERRADTSGWPRLLLENALHYARADAEFPPDLEHTLTCRLQLQYSRVHGWLRAAPTELGPVRLGTRETRIDPLSNDPALELGKYPTHLKHCPAGSGCPRSNQAAVCSLVDGRGR